MKLRRRALTQQKQRESEKSDAKQIVSRYFHHKIALSIASELRWYHYSGSHMNLFATQLNWYRIK